MNPNNRVFAWLGVLSTATGIIGFLMQIGATPVLAPLAAVVSIPVWLLICILLAFPWVIGFAVKHSITSHLKRMDEAQTRIADLEKVRASFEAQASTISTLTTEANLGKAAALKLAEYERLEQEIVGHLKGGERLSILELEFRIFAGPTTGAKQKLSCAIASLGARISGTNGKYHLVERHNA